MFLFIFAELNIDEALHSKISIGSFTISLSIITRKIPTLPDCFLQETNICHLNRWYFRILSNNLHIFIYMYIRTYVRECIDYNIQTLVLENRKKLTSLNQYYLGHSGQYKNNPIRTCFPVMSICLTFFSWHVSCSDVSKFSKLLFNTYFY